MMNTVVVIVGILIAVVTTDGANTYETTWDNIDLDKILANDRLVQGYINCLLDRGSCTPDGAALKRILPEALRTECAKCTQKQKEGGIKVIKFIIEKKPNLWKQVSSKYDPDGQLTKKFKQRY